MAAIALDSHATRQRVQIGVGRHLHRKRDHTLLIGELRLLPLAVLSGCGPPADGANGQLFGVHGDDEGLTPANGAVDRDRRSRRSVRIQRLDQSGGALSGCARGRVGVGSRWPDECVSPPQAEASNMIATRVATAFNVRSGLRIPVQSTTLPVTKRVRTHSRRVHPVRCARLLERWLAHPRARHSTLVTTRAACSSWPPTRTARHPIVRSATV